MGELEGNRTGSAESHGGCKCFEGEMSLTGPESGSNPNCGPRQ